MNARTSILSAREPDTHILVEPGGTLLAQSLARTSRTPSTDRQRFREELGLPTDLPIVMGGHQAQFWHPGILAKWLAADALAEKTGSAAAWVTVDQDDNDPWPVRLPILHEGTLGVTTWRADGAPPKATPSHADLPTGRRPALLPQALPADAILETSAAPSAAAGLAEIHAALAAGSSAPSAAAQVARALERLTKPFSRPLHTLLATDIARTKAWSAWIDTIRADPARCMDAYNRAVAGVPAANVRALGARPGAPGDLELPLWRIGAAPGSPRERAYASTLNESPASELVPRALAMTAILRALGCDLFIHGIGGGVYDAITERWLAEWTGQSLSPTGVVSATVRLAMSAEPITRADIDRSLWLAHRARHDPGLLGDPAAAASKAELVAKIDDSDSPPDRLRWYTSIHESLRTIRESHAASLRALDQAAASAAGRRAEADLFADRTWAFPLYAPAQLQHLHTLIRAAV